jgi:NADH:ubiquinone oxidoreductase subunit E
MEKGMSNTKEPTELAICMGSSCFSRGNKRNIKIIQEYIGHHGLCGKVSLKGHLCEGLCKDGPNITVDGQVFNAIDSDFLEFVLDQQLKPQE